MKSIFILSDVSKALNVEKSLPGKDRQLVELRAHAISPFQRGANVLEWRA